MTTSLRLIGATALVGVSLVALGGHQATAFEPSPTPSATDPEASPPPVPPPSADPSPTPEPHTSSAAPEGPPSPAPARIFHRSTELVGVGDDVFAPRTITIDPDDEVTWRNDGATVHTVTADDGAFDSGSIAAGARFSFTFTRPGTYAYYCAVHGAPGGVGMAGTVVVRGATAEPSVEGSNDQMPAPGATAAPAATDTLPATGASWAWLMVALALLASGALLLLISSRRSALR